jgi:transposase
VLLSAGRLGTVEVMRRTGKSKTCVWRWQERFAEEGVEGLLRDKTRPSRMAPLGQEIIDRVVALTATEPPHEATHWTGAAMAKAVGLSVSSVQRIWKAHGLAPHRVRRFKLSNDPEFVPKLRDIIGLYVDPPAHAVVLSVDEKSQIQALDRTQPGLPLKKGRAGTMTHDYKRHGTTTLFAALNILDGTVLGRCMQRHRHQEFIRFLNAIEAQVPAGKLIHVVLDNYGAHKQPKVIAWLARHSLKLMAAGARRPSGGELDPGEHAVAADAQGRRRRNSRHDRPARERRTWFAAPGRGRGGRRAPSSWPWTRRAILSRAVRPA